jgi:hypothetical protein
MRFGENITDFLLDTNLDGGILMVCQDGQYNMNPKSPGKHFLCCHVLAGTRAFFFAGREADMPGYAKLFSSIVGSSIWDEDSDIRVVWITMLAMADASGYVEASIPGLARFSRVSVEKTQEALTKFKSPDQYSRTQMYDGRRIMDSPGGWTILNYRAYRQKPDPDIRKEQNRVAQAKYRAKHRQQNVSNSKH